MQFYQQEWIKLLSSTVRHATSIISLLSPKRKLKHLLSGVGKVMDIGIYSLS